MSNILVTRIRFIEKDGSHNSMSFPEPIKLENKDCLEYFRSELLVMYNDVFFTYDHKD